MTTAQMPDILSAAFASDPYAAYRVMREDAPLIWHEPMQSYIVSRYADVERAFRDQAFTTANYDWQLEPVHGRTILQLNGREHSLRRALVLVERDAARAAGQEQQRAQCRPRGAPQW